MGSNVMLKKMSTNSDEKRLPVGEVGWIDMCVDRPKEVADFYSEIVGWDAEPFQEDESSPTHYFMKDKKNGKEQAGVCDIKEFDPWVEGWIPYVRVEDFDERVKKVEKLGGKIIAKCLFHDEIPNQRVCLIQDPSGAGMMLRDTMSYGIPENK